MITDITKFLEQKRFFKGSTVEDIFIPNGGNKLFIIVNDKSDNTYKNLHKLSFSQTEQISQINNGIKSDKLSNIIDSLHVKSSQVINAHTVELIFADTRRMDITFHHLEYSSYSDEQDIIISK